MLSLSSYHSQYDYCCVTHYGKYSHLTHLGEYGILPIWGRTDILPIRGSTVILPITGTIITLSISVNYPIWGMLSHPLWWLVMFPIMISAASVARHPRYLLHVLVTDIESSYHSRSNWNFFSTSFSSLYWVYNEWVCFFFWLCPCSYGVR